MKLANLNDRAVLVLPSGQVDVHKASGGMYGPCIHDVLDRWDQFRNWVAVADLVGTPALDPVYDPVVPKPRQVFAVGLNYREHALESGLPIPEVPLVFTKFPSSIGAADASLELPTDQVDWEVEVAVVIGRETHRIGRDQAWDHVAGVTAAQDYSARDVQLAGGGAPQFSLGKSFPGFTPVGPLLVTPDEYGDRDAIGLACVVNGVTVQKSSTADLIFDVATTISYLSHIVTLLPGDLVLTGTPSGVGLGMKPPRYLAEGDVVETTVDLVGTMRQVCQRSEPAFDPALILA